ncbi:MAG: hypothetical protein QOD81_206 [Solirubrobacteraceae bacterium]|nr:hypothetical protein [Solirubrobacteraceae bacterium]
MTEQQRHQRASVERAHEENWRYERFLTTIRQETGLDRDHVERAAMAMLTTLAERISGARAQELAEDVPEHLRLWLREAKERPETFHVEEFVRRVAEREEVDAETAARHARAAFTALARVAPAYEIDDLVDELPHEYEPLVGDVARQIREAGEPEVRSFEEFLDRVRRRADLDLVEAQRAAETVLETLAERLVEGEVEDLQAALPGQFREALQRGRVHVRGTPRRMSLDEFVERVARKEDVAFDEAFAHTRAVFGTLAEALAPKELRDILHELPRGYRETLF